MPNATTVDLIRRFYQARDVRDLVAVRETLAPNVAWHDPYPPPHGGDLVGADAVIAQIIEAADRITGGTTRLALFDVLANASRAVAIVDWSATIRGRQMTDASWHTTRCAMDGSSRRGSIRATAPHRISSSAT